MKYENGYKHTIGYRDDKMHRDAKNDIVLTTVGLNIRIGQRLIREGNTKLAEFLGVSYIYLDNIRYGKNTFPIRQGISICQYMRLTPNSILDIEDHFMESDSRPEYTNYKYTDKDIGERVSFFRFCSNLSLEQLSVELKNRNYPMSENRLEKIETGRETLTLVVFARLMEIFKTNPDDFFDPEYKMRPSYARYQAHGNG